MQKEWFAFLPYKKVDISHGNFGFFAYYIKNRVSFSALTMEQTGLVLNETGLIYERRRSSSVPNVPTSTVTLHSLLSEINALKEKIRQLEERVQTLERANSEVVDLTGDVSFDSTVSVHSSDMSEEIPNGI